MSENKAMEGYSNADRALRCHPAREDRAAPPRPETSCRTDRRRRLRGSGGTWIDVALVLALGLMAEGAHFSWRDGRPILSGDSVQYVDAAEGLLNSVVRTADPTSDKVPNFAVRKPGYPFILAGTALLTGDMSWAALAANHFFLGLLPLAAYGLGRYFMSRFAGWVAALLTIAQLQAYIMGGRIMSEAAYMCFLTFGTLALIASLKRSRSLRLVTTAGCLLAIAWSIRSVAIVVIAVGVGCQVWMMRHHLRRQVVTSLCLLLPLGGAVLFECGMNQIYGGRFRTSTGSFGLMLMMRARHLQGLPMPESEAGRRCLALLPERDPQDAYRASELDTWIARYRAVHDHGLDDWQTDALMKSAAFEIVAAHPVDFLRCSLDVFLSHLLRRKQDPFQPPSGGIQPARTRRPCVVHPAGVDDPDFQESWYAYWALPHRTLKESLALSARMQAAAKERAPFAKSEPFPTLRYVSMLPSVADVTGVLRGVASLWPGFALILCFLLGLNRRACAFFTIVYVLEAILISVCCPSAIAATRYQGVWLATDTALTAALISAPVHLVWARIKARTSPAVAV